MSRQTFILSNSPGYTWSLQSASSQPSSRFTLMDLFLEILRLLPWLLSYRSFWVSSYLPDIFLILLCVPSFFPCTCLPFTWGYVIPSLTYLLVLSMTDAPPLFWGPLPYIDISRPEAPLIMLKASPAKACSGSHCLYNNTWASGRRGKMRTWAGEGSPSGRGGGGLLPAAGAAWENAEFPKARQCPWETVAWLKPRFRKQNPQDRSVHLSIEHHTKVVGMA